MQKKPGKDADKGMTKPKKSMTKPKKRQDKAEKRRDGEVEKSGAKRG
ncbi:hypothetical protein [Paenibacillus thiaminolyticus]|nr:hypothetical protein [Paenibacillus thiaminolyticus]WII39931.1 hypothetical protein O0V01_12945 [Paenibacillus thiaminolyticus]